ncbi:hypothetical protein KUTeg_011755, partial [Tegillarca granosa]
MDNTEDLTLENISCWKVDSLKSFLTKRGLSTDSKKQELIALCFAAAKMNIATVPSNDEYLKSNAKDYDKLLFIDGQNIPDPLKLSSNCLDEKEGMSVWPPVFLSDIANFFMCCTDTSKASTYLNDYKLGKAYEYFSAKWIKDLFYHPISRDSSYCFLRAKCTPSQRVNDEDHTVWVCTTKDTWAIKSAYCSCTAGLGQTCNHVAGLLFRLESANKLGTASCTSVPCTWNIPKGTGNIRQRLISEIKIKKSRHGKDAKRPLVANEKLNYEPLESVSSDREKLAALWLKGDNSDLLEKYLCNKHGLSYIKHLLIVVVPKHYIAQCTVLPVIQCIEVFRTLTCTGNEFALTL